eukprot:TRINITY_DN13110_c0_g1_i1.p1 TRINITY_DN13110_c0_g1~~TRINITY_DN13110_c0_g1_i1.p1  ORF type:complete len:460 (-),score=105.65 TRINITY_DN13110_c0_g1_i1:494-1873(-)
MLSIDLMQLGGMLEAKQSEKKDQKANKVVSSCEKRQQKDLPTYAGWPTVGPAVDKSSLKMRQAQLKGHVDWVCWTSECKDMLRGSRRTASRSAERAACPNSTWCTNYGYIGADGQINWPRDPPVGSSRCFVSVAWRRDASHPPRVTEEAAHGAACAGPAVRSARLDDGVRSQTSSCDAAAGRQSSHGRTASAADHAPVAAPSSAASVATTAAPPSHAQTPVVSAPSSRAASCDPSQTQRVTRNLFDRFNSARSSAAASRELALGLAAAGAGCAGASSASSSAGIPSCWAWSQPPPATRPLQAAELVSGPEPCPTPLVPSSALRSVGLGQGTGSEPSIIDAERSWAVLKAAYLAGAESQMPPRQSVDEQAATQGMPTAATSQATELQSPGMGWASTPIATEPRSSSETPFFNKSLDEASWLVREKLEQLKKKTAAATAVLQQQDFFGATTATTATITTAS